MALDAVVFPQDLFGYNSKDLYSLLGGNWSYDFGLEKQEERVCFDHHFPDNQTPETNSFLHGDWSNSSSPPSMVPPHFGDHHRLHHPNSSSDATNNANGSTNGGEPSALDTSTTTSTRAKRRRSKSRKNKEEIENQRMTHIAVERNRRKQMNEYLSVLRSLMPESYVQRGDQASIIGGAINFVKELEHRLQFLSAQNEVKERSDGGSSSSCSAFAEFFTFPQYSTSSTRSDSSISMNETMVETQSAIADIEVTMVESHANLKIRAKRRPAQLLKVVSGLNSMRLSILHLNVTTVDQTVLYSLSVKVEDDCKLTSVDDIATAVNQLLGRIQEDAMLN
ncbi:PREDICTED: transcription factor bHLH94 [Theobroma cacao]|uniref:Transcription factor bHLH94 n=2 Tax=Theobroma cacao TaxID=3641 RepID=A0AB32WD84_THECC|nr:PREDICTED: transcription factor bHLH94 [Theobroma cacao]EOY11417.1 Basic helix-loop-helix DNA-binding superfamily protein, putative [Theobroma cacao]